MTKKENKMSNDYDDVFSKLSEISNRIKADGFLIISTETDGTRMAYTVGLSASGLPEIVVFGLPPATAHGILNDAAELLKEDKLPLDAPISGLATNLPLVCKQVPAERGVGYINVAIARAGRPVNLIQLVWPDEKGRFPWQKKFDKKLRRLQLSLYHQAS
jgi:hypothetical protein